MEYKKFMPFVQILPGLREESVTEGRATCPRDGLGLIPVVSITRSLVSCARSVLNSTLYLYYLIPCHSVTHSPRA